MYEHPKRVLAIQSHVVSGYVGNKCVVLPLNRLGFDVDAINSVQLSNNSGYPHVTGQQLTGQELEDLVQGLESNDLLDLYTHVLSGYIGNPSMVESIARVVVKLKEKIPGLVYMCDPVCGDNGALYVDSTLPQAFEEVLVPLATIITPNQFEAELLSKTKIVTSDDAVHACGILHKKGPSIVVITSLSFSPDCITVMASVADKDGSPKVYTIDVPKVGGHFLGTGDLFMSLMLGWVDQYPDDLPKALEMAVGGVQAVLYDTFDKTVAALKEMEALGRVVEEGGPLWWKCRELRLIDNQDKLLSPAIRQRAKQIV